MEIKIIPKRYFLYYGILRNIRNIDLNFAIPNSHHMINKEEDAKDRFAFSWKQGGSYNRITRILIFRGGKGLKGMIISKLYVQ